MLPVVDAIPTENAGNMTQENDADHSADKAGWRPSEWNEAVGISRTSVWRLMKEGKIDSVAIGRTRVIITPPSTFLERVFKAGGVHKLSVNVSRD